MIFKNKEELKEYIIKNGTKETSGVGKNKTESINIREKFIVFEYGFNCNGDCYSGHDSISKIYRYNVNRDVLQVYEETYSYSWNVGYKWKDVKFKDNYIVCSTLKEGDDYKSVYESEHQDLAKKKIEEHIKDLNKGIRRAQKKINTLEKKLKTLC